MAAGAPPRTPLRAQLVSVFGAVVATIAAIGTVASLSVAAPRSAAHDVDVPQDLTPNSVAATPLDSGSALVLNEGSGESDGFVSSPANSDVVAAAEEAIEMATALVAATRTWGDCIASAAIGAEATNRIEACGPQPTPDDYEPDTTIIAAGSAPGEAMQDSGGLPPGQVMKDDPEALPPGQVMKDDPETLPPGQVMKDDPETLPPGQAKKEDPSTVPPGQAKEEGTDNLPPGQGKKVPKTNPN